MHNAPFKKISLSPNYWFTFLNLLNMKYIMLILKCGIYCIRTLYVLYTLYNVSFCWYVEFLKFLGLSKLTSFKWNHFISISRSVLKSSPVSFRILKVELLSLLNFCFICWTWLENMYTFTSRTANYNMYMKILEGSKSR